jgi:hypothetical protein
MRTHAHEGVTKSFRTESITRYTLTTINTRWEAIRRVMAAKLTRLTHKIATQMHLVAGSYTICSSGSRRPVWKVLDTLSYEWVSECVELMALQQSLRKRSLFLLPFDRNLKNAECSNILLLSTCIYKGDIYEFAFFCGHAAHLPHLKTSFFVTFVLSVMSWTLVAKMGADIT